MKFDPEKPYNDLQLLPPSVDIETKAVLKKAIQAGRALAGYYRLLRAVTEKQEWEPWILYILDAVQETAVFTRKRIVDIRDLLEETAQLAKRKLPSRVYSRELMELIFRQPYTKVQFLVEEGIAKRQTAAEYLKALEAVEILAAQKKGKEVLYVNTRLYALLSK